jgi:hypothetical protein
MSTDARKRLTTATKTGTYPVDTFALTNFVFDNMTTLGDGLSDTYSGRELDRRLIASNCHNFRK